MGDGLAFEQGTGFLLSRLGSLVSRSWAAFLAGHDLTQIQYMVLMAVGERGSLGQRRLAELIAVDARNIVPVLDGLAARGLLERRVDDADQRRRIITLTPAGADLVAAVAASAATEQEQFLGTLTRRQSESLNRLLRQVYGAYVRTLD
ncbi:MarR family transcriptional regulator [Nonomuraea sp. NBC_01738]|uniref:MarR family winged helix-turn-helix transcriptional regulator n=1 Tax=Nonomuraea sp. NBC_01738 TaxID=2976003 RepID=UPI002E10D66B|nr:MarR family transcriptional regulator [Nonomuraea sp. NBC_01738]